MKIEIFTPLFGGLFLLVAVLFVVLLILVSFRLTKKKGLSLKNNSEELKKEVIPQSQVVFVDLSPKSADVVDLATEIWRINNRISKISNLSEIQKRGLDSSTQKLLKYLDLFEIKIIDYTNEKYNDGMNVNVRFFEPDSSIKNPIIKETIEPTITCRGQIVKKGEVIVTTN